MVHVVVFLATCTTKQEAEELHGELFDHMHDRSDRGEFVPHILEVLEV